MNDDLATWALIASYDEEFEYFYLWTPSDEVCLLTADFNSNNIQGFFVSETEESPCPFIEEQGWTYASFTFDEETQDPISITGPWSNEWNFLEETALSTEYPSYYEEFINIIDGDEDSSDSLSESESTLLTNIFSDLSKEYQDLNFIPSCYLNS